MKKIINIFLSSILSLVFLFNFSIKTLAFETTKEQDFKVEIINSEKVYRTMNNGKILFESYFKSDGNLYIKVQDKEILALVVENSPVKIMPTIIPPNDKLLRAPSDFILSHSSHPKKITITKEVIDLGKDAVFHSLMAFMQHQLDPLGISTKFYNGKEEALNVIIEMAIKSYGDYDTTVTQKNYKHQSCSWLTYVEFIYIEGPIIESYTWSDNPSLGVATSMCKVASQTYPF